MEEQVKRYASCLFRFSWAVRSPPPQKKKKGKKGGGGGGGYSQLEKNLQTQH